MKLRFASFAAYLFALAASLLAQADPDTIAKIVEHGKNRNRVMDHLTYLCKEIGPRLTGSPQLERACHWTARKFREFGCKNVRLEKWGEVPVGFWRGPTQIGRMVKPYPMDFQFTSPSWSPPTKGVVRAPAVLEPQTMAEFDLVKKRLKGAWLISRAAAGGRPGGPPPQQTDEQRALAEAIAASGYAGRITGSRNDLVHTSGRFRDLKWEALPTEIRITVRKKDMDAIRYNLDTGKEVVLEFAMEQKFVPGPIPQYNVIAEIPGTEKPDEVVIVSGHLDSWDGPGSEGCCDNGTGTMVALEAARILNFVGAKPKRTIRFILWTGEEQGLLGSRAYVQMHKDELDKISCVFVDDGGTNYQGGLSCTAAMEPMLRAAIEPATKAFPEFPMQIRVVERIPRGGGSDHAPFNAVGVPGFFWFETGRADYPFIHHTQNDHLQYAIPEYLVQSSVNSACASYVLACAETLLPREAAAAPPPAQPVRPPLELVVRLLAAVLS